MVQKELVLTLSAEQLNILKWFVDAAYAVHADFKGHTGMTMTMGQGTIMSMSRKQNLNTKSSTTAELVGADDATTMMLWTKLFMEEQGYKIEENVISRQQECKFVGEEWKKKHGQAIMCIECMIFFHF